MPFEFKLPDVGEGTTEGEIIRWLVEVGDTVELDQPLVEMETDKAVVELPSPRPGVILARYGEAGEVRAVGSPLVIIGEPGGETTPAPKADAVTLLPPAAKETAAQDASLEISGGVPRQVQAAPATRRLAKAHGIDLQAVVGSGPGGRIVPRDIRGLATVGLEMVPEGPDPLAGEVPAAENDERELVEFHGLRRQIRDHLLRSLREIPHVTIVEKVDATELVALRERLKPDAERHSVRLTYLPIFVKILNAVLPDYPSLNARWENGKFYRYRHHHVGVAVNTPDGLLVPVIRNTDERSVLDIARDMRRLADAARTRSVAPADLGGSTITITAGGSLGGRFATPIINYPEAAIVGMYRIQPEPAVYHGEITIRQMMHITLTFDHRVADGVEASRMLTDLVHLMEHPEALLARLR